MYVDRVGTFEWGCVSPLQTTPKDSMFVPTYFGSPVRGRYSGHLSFLPLGPLLPTEEGWSGRKSQLPP